MSVLVTTITVYNVVLNTLEELNMLTELNENATPCLITKAFQFRETIWFASIHTISFNSILFTDLITSMLVYW